MIRAFRAIATWAARAGLSGPLPLLALGLFPALLLAFPRVGEASSALRIRGDLTSVLGAGQALLLLLAVALPGWTAGRLGRRDLGRTLAAPWVGLAAFCGHALVLIALALGLAATAAGVAGMASFVGAEVWPDSPRAPVALRRELAEAGADVPPLSAERPHAVVPLALETPADGGVLRVRLRPQMLVRELKMGLGAEVGLQVGLRVPGGEWLLREVKVRRGRPVEVGFGPHPSLRGARRIEVGLRVRGAGWVLRFGPERLTVLGGRASVAGALGRAFLQLALGLLPLLGLVLWVGRMTRWPVAAGLGLTLAALSLLAGERLPIASLGDAGAPLARGVDPGWAGPLRALGPALLGLGLAALPPVGRESEASAEGGG